MLTLSGCVQSRRKEMCASQLNAPQATSNAI